MHTADEAGGLNFVVQNNNTSADQFGVRFTLATTRLGSVRSDGALGLMYGASLPGLLISTEGNHTIPAAISGNTLAVEPDPTYPAVEVGFRGMPEIAPANAGQDISRAARGKMTYVTGGALYFNTAYGYLKDEVYPVWNNTAANMILGTFGVTFIVNGVFTTANQTVLPYRMVTVIFVTTTTALVVGIE
jgi:hypothetical protein